MTTESFAEFLNKLKEVHEKEVQGLHSKVTELTTEKCRDAQRIEELFAKNHQLREQQKVLKENVKVLENRLRAGLCDRCMVTQELAKKKQNEYETSHFQSLQHIFILSNETNRLREENKTLKEELKRLRSLEDRTRTPGVSSRESCSTPSSPLTVLSPVSRNVSTEKAEHREAEEAQQDVPDLKLSEEKPPEKLQRSSPSSRTSPGTVLQEVSLAEIASQRISNQLHGTIALVRPGSRPCLLEKSPSGAAVSPPARKTPLPPEHEHSPSLEAYLTASKLDSPKVAPSYENLKLSARREQLCLLHKHLSLHQLGLAGPCAPAERDSFPSPLLRAKAAEGRTRSRDSWDDHAALLKLPATMVYVRDQQLEEKLQLLKQRERLQHLLLQQCQPGQRDTKLRPGERPLSPWLGIAAACKEESFFLGDAADGKEEKELWLGRERSELRAKVKEARDDDADAPLDLSDSGRGRDGGWHGRRELRGCGSPRDSPAGDSPAGGHRTQRDNLRCPYHWPSATRPLPGAAKEEEEEEDAAVLTLSRAYLTNSSTPSDPEALPEAGMRRDVSAQKGEADDNDAESGKQESDEPDTTDSEEKYEDELLQESEADGKYFCTKDKVHVQQRKRKRGQDPWMKGSKKSMRGKKKIKVEQCPVGITKELENCSASHTDPSKES
ncbi:RBBP8 N-terminal-like protein isoform X1 [Poecile atricapillus]|uniref:RBBP8 N-terminal-like protein isoform X1 n=1 Tax=Poecile atricapillus TaxID=48891 RepID=UPI002738534B|nr:RBBP8 N-terminal-like protein isoform X1 [Poecile atricapillus]